MALEFVCSKCYLALKLDRRFYRSAEYMEDRVFNISGIWRKR